MFIKFGIDGTGPISDAKYAKNFANSHVKKICSGVNEYVRGPIGPGGGMPEGIATGLDAIAQKRLVNADAPILLTGYSRGGLGAVVIAKRLRKEGIPVEAMLLFDCVDRHIAYDAAEVPDNVKFVHHVRRSPLARSRMSFGNDATEAQDPTKTDYTESFYVCTHGAMGGTPWKPKSGQVKSDFIDEGFGEAYISTGSVVRAAFYRTNVTFAQDDAMSQQIWRDIQGFARTHGFLQ